MQWPKPVEGSAVATGKLMRVPIASGPAETVMDITGHPGILSDADPTNSVGGFPSFRCPVHAGICVLAQAGENQIVFTAKT